MPLGILRYGPVKLLLMMCFPPGAKPYTFYLPIGVITK